MKFMPPTKGYFSSYWFENKLNEKERAFNNYIKSIQDKPKRKRKSIFDKIKEELSKFRKLVIIY